MPKESIKKLQEDFIIFFKSMEEVHNEKRHFFKKDDYFFEVHVLYDDLCLNINYDKKELTITVDDDFYNMAYLPYCFRFLSIEFIASVLWGENHGFLLTPNSPSLERVKWMARQDAEKLCITGFMGVKPGQCIANKHVRYALLELMDENHPDYKAVLDFKMKKRYRYVRQQNAKARRMRFLNIGDGTSQMYHLTEKELTLYIKQFEIISKYHEKKYPDYKQKLSDTYDIEKIDFDNLDKLKNLKSIEIDRIPLTQFERDISIKKGLFPITRKSYSKEEQDYEIYVYGRENLIFEN